MFNMLALNKEVYALMEHSAPYLTLWIAIFFMITIVRLIGNAMDDKKVNGYGSIISELPGLPLIFMHTAAFVKAIQVSDWISAFLFSWWGPGFFIFAAVYLYSKFFKVKVNWAPFGLITSYACKINYVIFMAIFYMYDMYIIMFVFSAWIICDQINLAWFLGTGDRTRRTFEDFWLLRIMYPAFLFMPLFFQGIPYTYFYTLLGIGFFIVWLVALFALYKRGLFFTRYTNIDYLRNIVYLSARYKDK